MAPFNYKIANISLHYLRFAYYEKKLNYNSLKLIHFKRDISPRG